MTRAHEGNRLPPTGAAPRVLLVDDDERLRAALRLFLEDSGIAIVGEAGDAESGIGRAQATSPDVVVVDVRLPGGGIEATRNLKLAVPDAKVFVLSAYDDPELTFEARAAGADAFHVKGEPPALLRDAIWEAWRGHR